MINNVYKLILYLLNKESKGYVTPDQFNELAYKIQMQIINEYFVDLNKAIIRSNRGNNNIGLTDNELSVSQKLSHLVTSKEIPLIVMENRSTLAKPEDLFFFIPKAILFDGVYGMTMIERADVSKRATILASKKIYEEFPIYFEYTDHMEVRPAVGGVADLSYLRKPKRPKWTYRMVKESPTSSNTTPMYNPSDPLFQDFDLHESEFANIVIKMLPELGLSLREKEVIDYGERLKQNEELFNDYNQQ